MADEKRQMAAQVGGVYPVLSTGDNDKSNVPRFLAEDALCSEDDVDDCISAISAQTLEEMAQSQTDHQQRLNSFVQTGFVGTCSNHKKLPNS